MQPNQSQKIDLIFYIFACLFISWSIWIPQALKTLGFSIPAPTIDSPLNLIAVWGPGLSSILVVFITQKRQGLRKLLKSLSQWRIPIYWYGMAFFSPLIINILALGIDYLVAENYTGNTLKELHPQYSNLLPMLIIFAIPNALGEELGWRGFVLSRLQTTYGPLKASIILGFIWGIWHIPTWIAQGITGTNIFILMLSIVATAVLFTWVYNNTNGSLLLAWLYHSVFTISGYFLTMPSEITRGAVLWIIVLFLIIFGKLKSPKQPLNNSEIN